MAGAVPRGLTALRAPLRLPVMKNRLLNGTTAGSHSDTHRSLADESSAGPVGSAQGACSRVQESTARSQMRRGHAFRCPRFERERARGHIHIGSLDKFAPRHA